MMNHYGKRALRFFGLASVLALTACGGPGVTSSDAIDQIAGDEIAGELQIQIINYEDGTAIEQYLLMAGEAHIELEFAQPPSVATGERIAVRGLALADRRIRGQSHRVLSVDDVVTIDDGLTGNPASRRKTGRAHV